MAASRLLRAARGRPRTVCCGLALLVWTVHALAQEFPGFIDYVLQLETTLQSQRNPFKLSYELGPAVTPDTVRTVDASAAAIVPLGSEDTRLLLSASLGSAAYTRNSQLDHQPYRTGAVLQWRLGELLQGSAGASGARELNNYLALSAPQSDVVTSERLFADVGLRVTPALTLPVLSVSHASQRYSFARNATLYNRDEDTVQAAVRYKGIDNSYLQVGVQGSEVRFVDRTADLAALVDDRYRDRELFLEGLWTYSIKTSVAGRLGYRRRSYGSLSERNVGLVNATLRADWQYSPKTLLSLDLWERPYANEEIPTILYSTLTGARATVRWQATDTLWYSLNGVREFQRDTRTAGEASGSSQASRVGARMEWAVDRGVKVVLDGWREEVQGRNYPSYRNNVLRLGVVLSHDNGGSRAPGRLLRSRDCNAPRYVETTGCPD